MSKLKFTGVVIYEILPDGCLNGIYTNDHQLTNGKIFNEIARKKSEDYNDVIGDYVCSCIDFNNQVKNCELTIRFSPKNNQYKLDWSDNQGPLFNGIGWLTRDNQLSVIYKG